MKINHYIATVGILVAFAAPGWAVQQADEHKDHHPAPVVATPKPTTASATPKPAPAAATRVTAAKPSVEMADMDAQMKRMREMHEKMMNAKTPKERNALMAEHMKVMQDGMNMMSKMSSQGMDGMKMKDGMPADSKDGMKDGMAEHHQMMEKRMEMMQMMMEMMMDRMSDSSTK